MSSISFRTASLIGFLSVSEISLASYFIFHFVDFRKLFHSFSVALTNVFLNYFVLTPLPLCVASRSLRSLKIVEENYGSWRPWVTLFFFLDLHKSFLILLEYFDLRFFRRSWYPHSLGVSLVPPFSNIFLFLLKIVQFLHLKTENLRKILSGAESCYAKIDEISQQPSVNRPVASRFPRAPRLLSPFSLIRIAFLSTALRIRNKISQELLSSRSFSSFFLYNFIAPICSKIVLSYFCLAL